MTLLGSNGLHNLGKLLSTHDCGSRVGPCEEESGVVSTATHTVVTGTVGTTNDDSEPLNTRANDSVDELGTVLGNTTSLGLRSDHEARNVLEEDQRDITLLTELDEVGALQRRLRVQGTVVGKDANLVVVNGGETTDQRLTVLGLELGKSGTINDSSNDLSDIVGDSQVVTDNTAKLSRVVERLLNGGRDLVIGDVAVVLGVVEVSDTLSESLNTLLLGLNQVVGHTRDRGVHLSSSEVLSRDNLTSGGLDKRRTSKENVATALDNDRLVRHGRHVSTASGTGTENQRKLGNLGRGHAGLLEEDSSKMVVRGEDISLVGKVGSSRVDEVQTRQLVLHGDFLGSEMLSHGDGEVGASLDGGVVGDDHASDAIDLTETGDDSTRRDLVLAVHVMASEQRELDKRGTRINEGGDSVSRKNLVLAKMLGLDFLGDVLGVCDLLVDASKLVGQNLEALLFLGKVGAQRVDLGLDHSEVCLLGRDMLVEGSGEHSGAEHGPGQWLAHL